MVRNNGRRHRVYNYLEVFECVLVCEFWCHADGSQGNAVKVDNECFCDHFWAGAEFYALGLQDCEPAGDLLCTLSNKGA